MKLSLSPLTFLIGFSLSVFPLAGCNGTSFQGISKSGGGNKSGSGSAADGANGAHSGNPNDPDGANGAGGFDENGNPTGANGSSGDKNNPNGGDGSSGDKNNPNGGDGSAGNSGDTWNGNQGTNGNPNTTRGGQPLDSPINPNDNGEKIQETNLKLGINFEDRGYKGDMDYNDDVLCFEGKFRVNKQTGAIISLADQNVTGYINRNASCGQKIFITITHPDETKTTIVREPAHQQPITETLSFKKNSLLEVKFQSTSDKCDTNVHTVVEQEFVLFSFDICNQ